MEVLNRLSHKIHLSLAAGILSLCIGLGASTFQGHNTRSDRPPLASPKQESQRTQQAQNQKLFLAIVSPTKPVPSQIERLLQAGASVNARDFGGSTPLNLASITGRFDLIPLLLRYGAQVKTQNRQGTTPLLNVLNHPASKARRDAVGILLRHGANPNERFAGDVNSFTEDLFCRQQYPLTHAVAQGDLDLVTLLLKFGASVNARDRVGETALYSALRGTHTDVIRLLLQSGAQVNVHSSDGTTPLMCTVGEGNAPYIPLLLRNGASLEARDKEGRTALLVACSSIRCGSCAEITICYPHCVKSLVEHGADVNATDYEGKSGLILLKEVDEGFEEGVTCLLQNGADPTHRDKQGKTVLHYLTDTVIEYAQEDDSAEEIRSNLSLMRLKTFMSHTSVTGGRDSKGLSAADYLKKACARKNLPMVRCALELLTR